MHFVITECANRTLKIRVKNVRIITPYLAENSTVSVQSFFCVPPRQSFTWNGTANAEYVNIQTR